MSILPIRRRRVPRWHPPPITTAEIVPAACGGFLMLLKTDTGCGYRERVSLGLRLETYDHHPNPIEILRADLALTERGMTRTADWTTKACGGCLTAPISTPDAVIERTPK
jgi:hypothetical protein